MRSALRFIGAARSDPALRRRLAALDPGDGLDDVVKMAAEGGFAFGAGDLRAAFVYDWGLRRARYVRETSHATGAGQ